MSDECFVCKKSRFYLGESKFYVDGAASESEREDRVRSLVEAAYVEGLAFGFNLRQDTTYLPACERHRRMLESALHAAGSKSVPVSPGGQG